MLTFITRLQVYNLLRVLLPSVDPDDRDRLELLVSLLWWQNDSAQCVHEDVFDSVEAGVCESEMSLLETTARKAAEAAAASELQAAGVLAVRQAQAEAANPVLRLLGAQQRLVAVQKRREELKAGTGDEKASAEDLAGSLIDLVAAEGDLESAALVASEVLGESVDAFFRLGRAAGAADDELQLAVDTINTFPTSVAIDLVLRSNVSAIFRAVDRAVAAASASVPAAAAAAVDELPLDFRRHGGPVAADEPFIVGEAGPELFIPDRAGRIIPNKGFGGGQSIVVNVNDSTTTDLAADLSTGLTAAQITQQVEMLRV